MLRHANLSIKGKDRFSTTCNDFVSVSGIFASGLVKVDKNSYFGD